MRLTALVLASLLLAPRLAAALAPVLRGEERTVTVHLDASLVDEPVTGRLLLLVSQTPGEPRQSLLHTFSYYLNDPTLPYPQLFGVDVEALAPGAEVTLDTDVLGYPLADLGQLAADHYTLQAVLHVYTRFERADGHVLWLPMDHGEGQQFHLSPGNLVSEPVGVDLAHGLDAHLTLTRALPPIARPPGNEHVMRFEIPSELASEFWGRPMSVHATAVLPRGYDEHTDVQYPLLLWQGHFFEDPAFGFPEDVPADARAARRLYAPNTTFGRAWLADDFPRMVLVTLQHPTPYYDDSYFIDSANNGPWGRVFMEEVLPALEAELRILRAPYARVLAGGSTGGWISAALQLRHPESFGGAWIFCPDPLDFRELLNIDVYRERNAFVLPGYRWTSPERAASRSAEGEARMTVRQLSQLSRVLGSKGRSGEVLDLWNALWSPVGDDGYPLPIWDHATGVIDREVAETWRDGGYDLRHHVEENWERIGPELVGKLHFACGDMDNFYLNLAMYRMEEALERTQAPHYGGEFRWGRPLVGHTVYGYTPYPMALIRAMAAHVAENTPPDADASAWHY